MATSLNPDYRRDASARSFQLHADTPFYSRNYGGFTKEQWFFFRAISGPLEGRRVLDPMAGQAFYLSHLAWEGCRVTIGDINPAPLLLALLRGPDMVSNGEMLRKSVMAAIAPLRSTKGSFAGGFKYCDDWIAPETKDKLGKYVTIFGLDRLRVIGDKQSLWNAPVETRFAAALPVLAARELTCFRSSDNFTWLKKGGLQRGQDLYGILANAVDRWLDYARNQNSSASGHSRKKLGFVRAAWMDAERGYFPANPVADIVVTSPAYANRLDYTSLWAPELAVVAEMFMFDAGEIKARQIGSTVIKGKPSQEEEQKELPRGIRKALADIRADKANVASETYYYPFFANYAVAMMRMLRSVEKEVRKNGRMIFFVRDTVRKDILFSTGQLVEDVLMRLGWKIIARERKIVRSHIGMRRRSARSGLYGFAQTEWWLAFERKKR